MTAPKLTERRGRTLSSVARGQLEVFRCAETNHAPLPWMREFGFVKMTRVSPWFGKFWTITDAGRAALKGES